MNIRTYVDDDLPAIYAIQLKCPQAAQWRTEDYLQLAHDSCGMILVAELEAGNGPEIAGFAAFHRVLEEAELRNMAIDPRNQRQGIAQSIANKGLIELSRAGARRLFLEVRASNQPALAFYAALGLKVQYRRRGYYHNPIEDALVMARDIAP